MNLDGLPTLHQSVPPAPFNPYTFPLLSYTPDLNICCWLRSWQDMIAGQQDQEMIGLKHCTALHLYLHPLTPHSLHQCPTPQPFYTPPLGCCCCCYWVIFSHLCMYLGIYLYLLSVGITVVSHVSFKGKLVPHILGCSPTVAHKHKPMCSSGECERSNFPSRLPVTC